MFHRVPPIEYLSAGPKLPAARPANAGGRLQRLDRAAGMGGTHQTLGNNGTWAKQAVLWVEDQQNWHFIYLSIYLSIYHYLSLSIIIYHYLSLSINLSIYLPIYLSICLSIYLPT